MKLDEDRAISDDSLKEVNKQFREIETDLVGLIMSRWFPYGIVRRIIMLIVFLLGLYGAIKITVLFILLWLSLPLFSPRITAYTVAFFGKLFSNK